MPEPALENLVVIEIFGEGKTDIGNESAKPRLPDEGVVPIIVHRLCGKPAVMRVKTKRYAHLEGKKRLWQKVCFAKRQASYNKDTRGAVFVLDTEGDDKVIADLAKGRDHESPDFPMAIGAARPCIEAWLLADASAIRQALELPQSPPIPNDPESLPAPARNREHNPKVILAGLGADSQAYKDAIAKKLDLSAVRAKCSRSFEPFAKEVESQLRKIFA